jgi:hypothetical protein
MVRQKMRHEQLTIRGIDQDLVKCIKELAEKEGVSLNKAAIQLLRKGAGLKENGCRRYKIQDALDSFMGTWSEEDEKIFQAAMPFFEPIDPEFWK